MNHIDIRNGIFLVTTLSLINHIVASNIILPTSNLTNITIAFGSCNKHYGYEPSDIFYTIAETKPDVFIWLGDVAYASNNIIWKNYTAGIEFAKSRFNFNKNDPPYQYLLKNVKNIIGTWDDHDYGANDGDKLSKYKAEFQKFWLDFMDEPDDSPRRQREGVYESYYLGDANLVKIILLDTRYHKDSRRQPLKGFWWDWNRDMLGEEQWIWFEKELMNNKAKYVVIGSGTQFMSDDRFFPECWYKKSRIRLINLLKKYNINGAVILSGDVHWGEIMTYPCWKRDLGYKLYELTSSGLTHNLKGIQKLITEHFWPTTFHGEEGIFIDKNFGTIRIIEDKFNNISTLYFEIRAKNGIIVRQREIRYDELVQRDYPENEWDECPYNIPAFFRFLSNVIIRLARFEFDMWIAVTVATVFLLIGIIILFVGYKLYKFCKRKFFTKKKVD